MSTFTFGPAKQLCCHLPWGATPLSCVSLPICATAEELSNSAREQKTTNELSRLVGEADEGHVGGGMSLDDVRRSEAP